APNKKKKLRQLADDAGDALAEVACQRAQMLRDLVAPEWMSLVLPVDCCVVNAAKAAGKSCAE
ncbi:unnamed protein product, partial [Prorocentrum cordatum]